MMTLKKIIIMVFIFTCILFPARGEMFSLKTMKDIKYKIEEMLKTQKPTDILVAFDIDMTLTQPDHPAVYYPALKKYMNIYKYILGQLTAEQKDLVATLTTQDLPQKLVEKETPQIIQALQKKGIKVIALTSALAGKIKGYKEEIMTRREAQLHKMSIDFKNNFKDCVDLIIFNNFKKYAGAYPMFYHGILSTNGEGNVSKGEILNAWLHHGNTHDSGFHPKVIVMIDDKKKHLESIEKSLKFYNPLIQFMGIEYKGAFTYSPRTISRANFQKFWEDLANQAKSKI